MHHLISGINSPPTSSATSWSTSSWLTILPWSSHLISVTITTLVIHHPIILSFQSKNFSFSQILSSIDIWHPLGLTSRLFGPAHGFYFYSFQFFSWVLVFFITILYFLPFQFFSLILVFFTFSHFSNFVSYLSVLHLTVFLFSLSLISFFF